MAMADDDPLVALARSAAIDLEYYDIWGGLHRSSPDALRAVFAAMGLDVSNDQAAVARLQETLDARWREIVPPVIVLREDATPWRVRLHFAQSTFTQPLRLSVREEHGRVHAASFTPNTLHRCGEATIESRLHVAVELELELPLPLGYHELAIYREDEAIASALLAIVPTRCYQPPAIEHGRVWGVTAQLYAVRSSRNWGIGDYTDLRSLVDFWGRRGAGIVGLNPQHALYAHKPGHCSPYSPNSRLFKNWLYIDVETCEEFLHCDRARALVASTAFQEQLQALRSSDLVDYVAVARAKREVLELAYAEFRARELQSGSERARAFREFQRNGGARLRSFALFEALEEHFAAESRSTDSWQDWPEAFRDPSAPTVQRFCDTHLDRVEFFEYLQWIVDAQLGAAAKCCMELGLGVGLYEDLAVSADRGGAETWVNQRTFALNASIGAPPDELNLRGQNWGLPPPIPSRLREARYAPFIEILRANMHHAGALRIDHAMSLMRLYWIAADASGADGVYVRYPLADLLGLVALESRRNRCMVIGEDLGTVPDEVRHSLEAAGVLSYRVIYFERDQSGDFKPPAWYPRQALVVASTHDLPTSTGWWAERDIQVRTALNLYPNDALRTAQITGRAQDRRRLLAMLAREGLLPAGVSTDPGAMSELTTDTLVALHAYLASTPACAMTVQLEDLFGAIEQVNVPGTVAEHPNWRRKLAVAIENYDADRRIDAMVRMLAHLRPRAGN